MQLKLVPKLLGLGTPSLEALLRRATHGYRPDALGSSGSEAELRGDAVPNRSLGLSSRGLQTSRAARREPVEWGSVSEASPFLWAPVEKTRQADAVPFLGTWRGLCQPEGYVHLAMSELLGRCLGVLRLEPRPGLAGQLLVECPERAGIGFAVELEKGAVGFEKAKNGFPLVLDLDRA